MKTFFKNFTVLMAVLFAVNLYALPVPVNQSETRNGIEVNLVDRNGEKSIVTEEEYNSANDFDRRMINQIDAAIAALEVLKENADNSDLSAIVSVSKNKNNAFSNAIIIAKEELSNDEEVKASCEVCVVRSAYSCLKKITNDESLGDEFDVHVKRKSNGCVEISW